MSKSIKQLFAAIAELKNEKQKETQLKKIEELAQKVLKKHNTLNVFQEDSDYVHTPLEAAIAAGSIRVFQLLVRLGADPFWKPKPDRPSAIDFFINHYFSRDHYHERGELFEWVLTDKGSPLFTWAKLKTNQKLDEAFKKANLKKPYLNELPIHVAIQAGSMDLVQQVVDAAGGLQRAGDISRMSVLSTALDAVLEGQKNSLEILKYLLEQGSSPQTSDVEDAPQLIHLLTRMTGSNIEEFIALVAVNLLLHHGASLDVTDARGCTPLMLAMEVGMPKLFVLLLDKADARTLNEQAQILLNYLLFQLLDKEESRLSTSDVLIALRQLKEKGLKFDQTIDYHSPADPFENATHSPWREIAVQNMSLLHFYVENMTRTGGIHFKRSITILRSYKP